MIMRCDLVPQFRAYREEIIAAIDRVLCSGRYILGDEVVKFEEEFAAYLGVKYAVGVGSGTDGLMLSMMALGIGKDDEVITTPYTAVPTVAAISATGAKPVFVEICRDTFLIDIDRVPEAITPKTKAILPVHIFGNVADIPKLRSMIGGMIPIIEDACQSHGSTMDGIHAGSMGDMGVFSFYPTKNLGGYGDAGIIASNNKLLCDKLRLLRQHGMEDSDHVITHGINSRMDELQAAVLRVKLKHLDEMNRGRNSIAQFYRQELRSEFFEHQHIPANINSNYHIFASRFNKDRERFIAYLQKNLIQTKIFYPMPIYLQKAYEYLGIKRGGFPLVEELCNEVMALPMYSEMNIETATQIIKIINEYDG